MCPWDAQFSRFSYCLTIFLQVCYIMSEIAGNIERIFENIAAAAQRSGRNADQVEVVAISKTKSAELIAEAVRCGVKHIGENKIQEAERKFKQLDVSNFDLEFRKHYVGHLQTNKAGKAVEIFDLIHSLDSLKLAQVLSRNAVQSGKTIEVLVQVNTSAEDSKFGVDPEMTVELISQAAELPGLKIRGLMTIGAFLPDPEQVRPFFLKLRRLSEEITRLKIPGVKMQYLSMGMTNDYETAIEEGANLVRIGTAVFGARNYH